MANKLTDKQKMFCREYLIDLNAKQAAIRAGYSEKTAKSTGSENMTKPDVVEYIKKLMDKRSTKVEVTAEYVLQTILDTVESSVAENDKQNIYKGAELLGKHLKLFTDKVQLGGDDDSPLTFTINKIVHSARDNDK
jgi:phage terminase small subunit